MGLIIPAGLMMSSRSILGVNMLKIADHHPLIMNEALRETIQLYKNQKIKVCVGGVFPASEIDKAHDLLESGNSTGKISVVWD
jgi:NADPH2:quinone reductase